MAFTPDDGRARRVVRTLCLALATVSSAWATYVFLAGGVETVVFGRRLSSTTPSRIVAIAGLALGGFLLAGGRIRVPARPFVRALDRGAQSVARRPVAVVLVLAASTFAVGFGFGSRAASGSDAWGYLSQAALWRDGQIKIDQPWVDDLSWPHAQWPFAPLGYRPAAGDEAAIVPGYSPGLPILMALAAAIVGPCGAFLIVPLAGAVAVVATAGIGRRLGSVWLGVVAAWFLATSPAVLGVLMDPISDVPAMAAWATAFYCVLGPGVRRAAAAGLLAGLAIAIRPNLIVLALPLAIWPVVRRRDREPTFSRSRFLESGAIVAGIVPIAAGIAYLNDALYGSPLSSGYGAARDLYAWSRVWLNIRRYFGWFVESETPLGVAGLLALAYPARRLWPTVPDRRFFLVALLFLGLLGLPYMAYFEYNSWGFLRFLLPGYPFVMLGLAASVLALGRLGSAGFATAIVLAIGLGSWRLAFTDDQGLFDQREIGRHEIAAAALVRQHTPLGSLVVTIQRSGNVRYYAGRLTARYDYLTPQRFERDVAWLAGRGVPVYGFFDNHEMDEFGRRFSSPLVKRALAAPIVTYAPIGLRLVAFDPAPRPSATVLVEAQPDDVDECVWPAPRPRLRLRR